MLLHKFMMEIFNYNQHTIPIAPSKYVLAKYREGGMSIDDYRNKSRENSSYTLTRPEIPSNVNLTSTNMAIVHGESNDVIAPIVSTVHEKNGQENPVFKKGMYERFHETQLNTKPNTRATTRKESETTGGGKRADTTVHKTNNLTAWMKKDKKKKSKKKKKNNI
tara:strand:- start:732 stop:1223 length:492 start_codon:yes stop_codon:yes gene_type:complete